MNKNWFRYLFRNYRIPVIFFTVVFFGLSAIPLISSDNIRSDYMGSVEVMTVLAGMMTYILPVILFSFVHNRRSADQLLALPLSRSEHLITNMVFAFTLIFGCFLITSTALWLINAVGAVPFTELLTILGQEAFFTVTLLVIHTFWFLIANNIFDGIVMIGAWSFAPLLFLGVLSSFVANTVAGGNFIDSGRFALWLSPLAMNVRNLVLALSDASTPYSWSCTLVTAVYTLAAGYGLYSQFVRRKSERAGQLSDHPLAYRLIINLYAFAILLMICFSAMNSFSVEFLTLVLLLLFIYVVAQFVYRRKIQLTVKILGMFAALTAAAAVCAFAAYHTHGFGQAERYTFTDNQFLKMDYSTPAERSNPGRISESGNYDELYVSAEVYLPVSKISPANEIWKIMEKYRHAGIDTFYSPETHKQTAYLSFGNTDSPKSYNYSNHYNYRLSEAISLEDLIAIDSSEYGSVTIIDYDDAYGTEYSLSAWLRKKGD
ncbi:MAG: hypothetical protein Q4B44_04740 [Erysipelotrichaceae bacterium]|nr:hypothetical protein [Erysipelotrichaceae bacterium]